MALHRYGDFRVEVFYFDSPCRRTSQNEIVYLTPTSTSLSFYLIIIIIIHCQCQRNGIGLEVPLYNYAIATDLNTMNA